MNQLSRFVVVSAAFLTVGSSAWAETSLTALRNHAGDQMRLEATAKTDEKKHDAAVALCDLYVILRSDDRFASSEMLQGTAAKVRRRLINIAKRLKNRLEREGKERPSGFGSMVDQAVEASLSADTEQEETSAIFGASAPGDVANGWALVELIQRVISPDFWEPVGGPGTAYYFPMRKLLVIRATTDVHQQIKDLLMALR